MARVVRKVRTFSIICVFFTYICIFICFIGANPAIAQFPFNTLYGSLFGGNQGMPISSPLITSNYQSGQAWNPFGSNLGPSFGVLPVGYYSGSTQTKEMAKGELIVYLSDQVQIEQHANGPRTNMPELNALLDQYGVYDIEASNSGGFYVLKFSEGHDVNDVRKAFEGVMDYVESAELNYIRKAHSGTSGFNTMMGGMMGGSMLGGWSPQISSFPGQSFPGQGFPYTGTGLNFGPWTQATQPFSSGYQFPQFNVSPGFTYSSSWQNQGLSFMQPTINQWQQTSWGIQRPYINLNSFPPPIGSWL